MLKVAEYILCLMGSVFLIAEGIVTNYLQTNISCLLVVHAR